MTGASSPDFAMSNRELVDFAGNLLRQDPSSQIFVAFAEEFCSRGLWQEAVEVCRRGLVFHPHHFRGRVLLGWALWMLGEATEAEKLLSGVREELEGNAIIYKILAEIAQAREDNGQAWRLMHIHLSLRDGQQATEPATQKAPEKLSSRPEERETAEVATSQLLDEPPPGAPDLSLMQQESVESPVPLQEEGRAAELPVTFLEEEAAPETDLPEAETEEVSETTLPPMEEKQLPDDVSELETEETVETFDLLPEEQELADSLYEPEEKEQAAIDTSPPELEDREIPEASVADASEQIDSSIEVLSSLLSRFEEKEVKDLPPPQIFSDTDRKMLFEILQAGTP